MGLGAKALGMSLVWGGDDGDVGDVVSACLGSTDADGERLAAATGCDAATEGSEGLENRWASRAG